MNHKGSGSIALLIPKEAHENVVAVDLPYLNFTRTILSSQSFDANDIPIITNNTQTTATNFHNNNTNNGDGGDDDEEESDGIGKSEICYFLILIVITIIICIGIYCSIPKDHNDDDDDDDNGNITAVPTTSPTSDQNLFPSTHFPTATMTMLPTSYPTIRPTQSSSTQSPTHSPTINPTISPITLSPTTTPITSSSTTSPITFSPTPNNDGHPEFQCGATKDEAKLCQYSCLVNECPMFEYCYEVSTCSSFI